MGGDDRPMLFLRLVIWVLCGHPFGCEYLSYLTRGGSAGEPARGGFHPLSSVPRREKPKGERWVFYGNEPEYPTCQELTWGIK